MLPLSYILPGVTPVPRHPRAGAPDHLHPVAEGGTRDQVTPRVLTILITCQSGDQRVHVHLNIVITLGHVPHPGAVIIGPHVSTQDLVTQQSVPILRKSTSFTLKGCVCL